MFLKRGRLSHLDLLLVGCLRGLEGRCSEAPLLESGLSPTCIPRCHTQLGTGHRALLFHCEADAFSFRFFL